MNAPQHPGNPERQDHAVSALTQGRSVPVDLCSEATRRLQSVSEKLGHFLQEQIKRLESATQQCEHILAQRQSVVQMQQDLRREQTDWLEQQEQLKSEISLEQDRLIQGWQLLEDEQRNVGLQGSVSPETTSADSTPRQNFSPALPSAGTTSAITPDRSVFAEQQYQPPATGVAMSRESALDQFQRLKREIRNHTQRVQQGPYRNGNH